MTISHGLPSSMRPIIKINGRQTALAALSSFSRSVACHNYYCWSVQ